MNSHVTAKFRKAFQNLPQNTQKQARRAYRLFMQNPNHPSLQFKPIIASKGIYSARINLNVRVLGVRRGETIIWFWIGAHAEYEKIINSL